MLALATLLECGLEARGALIVSNLNETEFGSNQGAFSAFEMANSFTTGPNPTVLNSATVRLEQDNGGSYNAANVDVRIYSDQSGSPGTSLATLTGPNTTVSSADTDVTYTGSLALAANSTYWLFMSNSTGTFPNWQNTSSTNQTSTDGWTIGDTFQTHTSANLNDPWNSPSSGPFMFAIDASASVPEPCSLLLSTVIAGPLALRAWRRRKQTV
jgi:hypothetical protein